MRVWSHESRVENLEAERPKAKVRVWSHESRVENLKAERHKAKAESLELRVQSREPVREEAYEQS